MIDDVNVIVSKVFSIPESEVNDESSPETIENWDSFNSLMLADELESEFNVSFTLMYYKCILLLLIDCRKRLLYLI